MTTLQIRHVPDDIHRKLKARAALAGQSLSEFSLAELRRSVERPTLQEMIERIRSREAVDISESPAAAVRAERDAR